MWMHKTPRGSAFDEGLEMHWKRERGLNVYVDISPFKFWDSSARGFRSL